ncbi:MAG: ATP-binding cassette domain-containing protein [Candidatus Methanoperedens sp.]|nr:ATP-binding cassette domain-containing protein [Candidatus Methanoperedens sp.]
MPLLEIKDMKYRVNDKEIFSGFSISVKPGEVHAILGITLAWQEPVRLEGISVRDYLTLKDREADTSQYLEMVGLAPEHYLNRMMDRTLSGGERKRIELASIIALEPELAILDEPDSGIDMLSIQDVINVINILKKNGAAVILITHREEIAKIADSASQICGGKIVCSGAPDEVAGFYKSKKCAVCPGKSVYASA